MKIPNAKSRLFSIDVWFCFLGVLLTSLASAQFAVADTRAGIIEIRESNQPNSKLVSQLPNGSVFFCFEAEEDSGWISVDFEKDTMSMSGFVQRADIKMVADFATIPYSYSNEHKMIHEGDGIRVVLTEIPFDQKNHAYEVDDESGLYLRIDGKEIYGTDGSLPKREYGSFDVTIANTRVQIPASALENLFEPSLEATQTNYDRVNDILYISSSNSDGAGGYEVLWIIEKRKYKTRYVFFGF